MASSVDFEGSNQNGLVEKPSDFGDAPEDQVAYWLAQDSVAEKKERMWIKRSRKIVQRYRDDRGTNPTVIHRYNVLWSNVQTIRPALYGRTPKPDIERRFRDDDPIGRTASILLERCCTDALDRCDFDMQMQSALDDYLLPGRGVIRVLYVPHFGEPIPPETETPDSEAPDEGGLETEGDPATVDGFNEETFEARQTVSAKAKAAPPPLREVVFEEARLKYVFWEDYREGPARVWDEVPWIKYRAFLTRQELQDRFGDKLGGLINLDATAHNEYARGESYKDTPNSVFKKAEIWEIWDKARKRAIWLAPGSAEIGLLDSVPDPLELPGFYPNPDPLLATTTTDQRIPVPDFVEYQDQAIEMDTLTARIDRLVRALKVVGIYAGEEKQTLQQMLDDGMENRMIAVEDWQSFTDKGGLANAIQWMPIETIAKTLIELYNARDRCKQVLYEITGMSDIMRGSSSPVETATAQQIKAQYGTLRLSDRQRAVAKFAKECIRLTAYVVGKHFAPQTISMMTGYPQLKPVPPQPQGPAMIMDPQTGQQSPSPEMQQWQQTAMPIMQANQEAQQNFQAACALLRDEIETGFRIDIEADSTIAPDEQAEKQAATEFLGALLPLMQQVIPMAQGNPAMADLSKEVVMFAVRRYRAGRPLEQTIEKAFDQLSQMPPPPPPGAGKQVDPAEGQAKMITAQSRAQADQTKAQADAMSAQSNAQTSQAETSIKAQESQATIGLQAQKQANENANAQEANRLKAVEIAQKQDLAERQFADKQDYQQATLINAERRALSAVK